MTEKKIKHLEIIQQTINRMSTNSFQLKGWSVTIVSALLIFILSSKSYQENAFYIALLPVLAFWYLDAFFLQQEKMYICLFDRVRRKEEVDIDFNMNAKIFKKQGKNILHLMMSSTLLIFYGTIFMAVLIISKLL